MAVNKAPDGVLYFNFKTPSTIAVPAADTIPDIVSSKVLAELQAGDENPFYKVEAIPFPANGTGGVYEKSFFESYLNVMKARPIPGSKRGHEWISRPHSDFYTTGGRIDMNADGKTGTAYLKIYIPKTGDESENSGFIRDARAGIVNFSLVTSPDFTMRRDEQGNQVKHFIASLGYERNDAVEYGAGAMHQFVNSSDFALDIDAATALIESGHFDTTTKIDGSPIQNGTVYRSALRLMASRANGEDASAIGELISAIDKAKQRNGGKTVETKDDALSLLGNLIENGKASIPDVAKALGFGDRLRNETDAANAELVKAINAKLGEKPLDRLEVILNENKINAEATVKNAIQSIAGPPTLPNPDPAKANEQVANAAFDYAFKACNGKSGDELTAAIGALKDDAIMKTLNAQRADSESHLNRTVKGGAGAAPSYNDGIVTHMVGGK